MHAVTVTLFLMLRSLPASAATGHHDAMSGAFLPLVIASMVAALVALGARRPMPFPRSVVLVGVALAVFAGLGASLAQDMHFTSHMLAQMVLMDVAAPVLAVTLAWSRDYTRVMPSLVYTHTLSGRLIATGTFHAAIMWLWHVPVIHLTAIATPLLHGLMQVSFLVAGVAFWRDVVGARGTRPGLALFWLFMMVMHTGLLGALLTFAPKPLYGFPLEDQQFGGLAMWVVGSSIYGLAGLAIAARWLAELDRHSGRARAA